MDNFIHGHSDYYWTVGCGMSHLYKTLSGHFVPNCPLMYGRGGGWVRGYERAGLRTPPLSHTHAPSHPHARTLMDNLVRNDLIMFNKGVR